MFAKKDILQLLSEKGLPFGYEEHEQVLNMAESSELTLSLDGARCKNLLLQDRLGQCYLVVTTADKSLDLAALAKTIGSKRLSFVPSDRMYELLGVRPGSLSPLALVNDLHARTKLVFDIDLASETTFLFHPLDSSATVALSQPELITFLTSIGHCSTWAHISARETV
ncbi:YbaK/EbsC family protein [Cupriavidus sp. 8B]